MASADYHPRVDRRRLGRRIPAFRRSPSGLDRPAVREAGGLDPGERGHELGRRHPPPELRVDRAAGDAGLGLDQLQSPREYAILPSGEDGAGGGLRVPPEVERRDEGFAGLVRP